MCKCSRSSQKYQAQSAEVPNIVLHRKGVKDDHHCAESIAHWEVWVVQVWFLVMIMKGRDFNECEVGVKRNGSWNILLRLL